MLTFLTRVNVAQNADRADKTILPMKKMSGEALKIRNLLRLWSLVSKQAQLEGKEEIQTSL
jgi:hypothetical protein